MDPRINRSLENLVQTSESLVQITFVQEKLHEKREK